MKCYICNKNNANTLEHIIPNGLNGKQKARILCHECNNKTGYMFDSKLIEHFKFGVSQITNQECLVAILKIATNFCVKNNISIPKHNAEYILKALNGEEVDLSNIVKVHSFNENYNAVIICGDKEKEMIYAIVSLFSLSYTVILDDNYKGEDFTKSYPS